MKLKQLVFILSFFFNFINTQSQEWKSLNKYKKETGFDNLQSGSWLKKDRVKNTNVWKQANKYNLSIDKGNLNYTTISQARDFYNWFDKERIIKGHEINAIGIAALVARQLSYFDNSFIRVVIVRNKEVVWFGNEGAKKVLEYNFPLLKEVYFSNNIIKGNEAKEWDTKNGKKEQCVVVEAIYNQLSNKAINKLEKMAKGKGIFNLGVRKELKFEGDIKDCKVRYTHAFTKLRTYYLKNKND